MSGEYDAPQCEVGSSRVGKILDVAAIAGRTIVVVCGEYASYKKRVFYDGLNDVIIGLGGLAHAEVTGEIAERMRQRSSEGSNL